MQVILLQNIKGVGRTGDVKKVSDGYGRNYLLAKKLAKIASEGNMREVESLKKKAEVEDKIVSEKAKEIAEKAKDLVLEFSKKASKTGKLFASLTKKDIAAELSKAVGGKIETAMIDLKEHGEHIKQTGEHVIEVELSPEVKLELKVVVKEE